MKKRVLISILMAIGMSGCALDDAIEWGEECPPRMFAYDVGSGGDEPYLCMLDNADVRDNGIPNCVPCDFRMNRVADDKLIILAKNNNGDYMYSNADMTEEDVNRKYLSEETKDYIIHRYSDYEAFVRNQVSENNQNNVNLYAISGLCTRNDLDKYDKCNELCKNNSESCDDECKTVIQRASKCLGLKEYKSSFGRNMCPKDYPICAFGKIDDTGNNYYCRSNIGECSTETVDIDCSNRITNWKYGRCESNHCVVIVCEDGFQASQNGSSCVANCTEKQHYDNVAQKCVDDDVDNCGATNRKCVDNVTNWVDGTCEAGVCRVSECSTGFKPSADRLSCASDCTDSQHYDNDAQKCVDDDINNCGATNRKCSENVTNWVNGTCESGVCRVSECVTGFKPSVEQLSCASDCGLGQHYDNDAQQCVDDDVDNCGATNRKCVDNVTNWADGTCESGVCRVSECVTGFKPTADRLSCASDCVLGQHYDNVAQKCANDDVDNCGAAYRQCSLIIPHWVTGKCEDGVCKLTECEEEFKPANDSLTCASDCPVGKHYDNTAQKCLADDIDNCGATNRKCADNVTHWVDGVCEAGTCKVTACSTEFKPANDQLSCASDCTVGKHYDNNAQECVPDDVDNCGGTDRKCSSIVTHWGDGVCESGICRVTQCASDFKPAADQLSCASNCKPGQHYDNDAQQCVNDDIFNCGATGYKCSDKVAQWAEGTCVGGACILSKCITGYQVINNSCMSDCKDSEHYDSNLGKCVSDDIYNCGSSGYSCAAHITGWNTGSCSKHQCIVSGCKGSYHVYNNTCEEDSLSNCGIHDYTCSETVSNWGYGTCTNHQCMVSSCKGNYHVYNNACEQDSTTHCGEHNYNCSEKIAGWQNGSCSNHQCVASSCKANYHLYGNTCEADSVSNCGSHGIKCESLESCVQGVCKCPGGYVDTTYKGESVRAACITTKDDFINFRNNINNGKTWPADNTQKYYILTRNVALGTQYSWVGAGTKDNPFTGVFLGNGKTISGSLTCSSDYCGIFGYVGVYNNNGMNQLTNLRSTVDVNSNYNYVGGIAGYVSYASVDNLSSSGNVSGKTYVGGLVGQHAPGNITDCSSSATVSATDAIAGGIVGYAGGFNITNCSSNGSVSASNGKAGGIVGETSGGNVKYSHSSGSISGKYGGYYGGIVGNGSSASLIGCYSTNNVSAPGTCGGLAGYSGSLTIESSYYSGNVSCGSYAGGLVGEMNSNSKIRQSGAFGYASGPTVGGLVAHIVKESKPVVIEYSFSVMDLSGGGMGGLVGGSDAANSTSSNLSCSWVGSGFKSSSLKGAVSLGEKTFTQSGPIFVYKPTFSSATNTNYAVSSNTFILNGKTPMVNTTPLLGALNGSCSGGGWKELNCHISNGMAGGAPGYYLLPLPGVSPGFCE